MIYGATSSSLTGSSPAKLLLDRNVKTTLLTLQITLQPKWPGKEDNKQADAFAKQKQACYNNRRNGVSNLPRYSQS